MSFSINQLDHVNVKIFARESSAAVDLEPAIPMFHRWIQDSLLNELLIDIADYRHVPAGPGIMIIGHSSNYSLDLAFSRLGLLYNSKLPSSGTLEEKLQRAFAAALTACALVEQEPAFRDRLSFDAGQCEVIFNDRLLAPNTDATWTAIQPEIQAFLEQLFGKDGYTVERIGEPRERLRLSVRASQDFPALVLLERCSEVFSKQ
jgi:hypothetical protein